MIICTVSRSYLMCQSDALALDKILVYCNKQRCKTHPRNDGIIGTLGNLGMKETHKNTCIENHPGPEG